MRTAAVLLAALVVAALAQAAPRRTSLLLRGDLRTSSARDVLGGGTACGYSRGWLRFQSEAMRLGRGTHVVRVSIQVQNVGEPGRFSAVYPSVAYGRTPVQAVTALNATTGVARAFFVATKGSVVVREAHALGTHRAATAAGALYAELREQHGRRRAVVSGTFHCSIEGVSNGP